MVNKMIETIAEHGVEVSTLKYEMRDIKKEIKQHGEIIHNVKLEVVLTNAKLDQTNKTLVDIKEILEKKEKETEERLTSLEDTKKWSIGATAGALSVITVVVLLVSNFLKAVGVGLIL